MRYGKFENEKLIICPKNGYVDGVAISNIDIFFDHNPEIAKKEGWLPIIELDNPSDNTDFVLKGDVICEVETEVT